GAIVASSLRDYLFRHPEMDVRLSKGGSVRYLTSAEKEEFLSLASAFLGEDINEESVVHTRLSPCEGL
ncbi:MAG: glutamate racemase, partial [Porphyromonas sp.]|nr:glutamate racemase [Porphyromonas sp.]